MAYTEIYSLMKKQAVVGGLADDVGVVLTSYHPDDVQIYASEAIWPIKSWLEEVCQSGGNRKLFNLASMHTLFVLSHH